MNNQRGFTLLEVIVAVSILALVLGSVYTVFDAGRRAGAAKSSEITLSARTSLDMMSAEIRSMCFKPGVDQFLFSGENAAGGSNSMDRISFCAMKKTPEPGAASRQRPERITYMIAAHPGSGATMLYRTVERIGVRGAELVEREPVAPFVSGLDAEYYAEGQWLTAWDRKDRAPEKIRIRLAMSADGDEKNSEWFELETATTMASERI